MEHGVPLSIIIGMIYLIGVNHEVQHNRHFPRTKAFTKLLSNLVKDFNIKLLAEEWSEDASKVWSVSYSTVEDVARINNIKYLACDPTTKEREMLGIKTEMDITKEVAELSKEPYTKKKSLAYQKTLAPNHAKREQFWLKQLQDFLSDDIIFVCATQHISEFTNLRKHGFDTLLRQQGHPYQVMKQRFD